MCLSTPNITGGVRKPPGLPSSFSILKADAYILVSSLLALLILKRNPNEILRQVIDI